MCEEITTWKHIPQRMMMGAVVEGKNADTHHVLFLALLYKPQKQEEKKKQSKVAKRM